MRVKNLLKLTNESGYAYVFKDFGVGKVDKLFPTRASNAVDSILDIIKGIVSKDKVISVSMLASSEVVSEIKTSLTDDLFMAITLLSNRTFLNDLRKNLDGTSSDYVPVAMLKASRTSIYEVEDLLRVIERTFKNGKASYSASLKTQAIVSRIIVSLFDAWELIGSSYNVYDNFRLRSNYVASVEELGYEMARAKLLEAFSKIVPPSKQDATSNYMRLPDALFAVGIQLGIVVREYFFSKEPLEFILKGLFSRLFNRDLPEELRSSSFFDAYADNWTLTDFIFRNFGYFSKNYKIKNESSFSYATARAAEYYGYLDSRWSRLERKPVSELAGFYRYDLRISNDLPALIHGYVPVNSSERPLEFLMLNATGKVTAPGFNRYEVVEVQKESNVHFQSLSHLQQRVNIGAVDYLIKHALDNLDIAVSVYDAPLIFLEASETFFEQSSLEILSRFRTIFMAADIGFSDGSDFDGIVDKVQRGSLDITDLYTLFEYYYKPRVVGTGQSNSLIFGVVGITGEGFHLTRDPLFLNIWSSENDSLSAVAFNQPQTDFVKDYQWLREGYQVERHFLSKDDLLEWIAYTDSFSPTPEPRALRTYIDNSTKPILIRDEAGAIKKHILPNVSLSSNIQVNGSFIYKHIVKLPNAFWNQLRAKLNSFYFAQLLVSTSTNAPVYVYASEVQKHTLDGLCALMETDEVSKTISYLLASVPVRRGRLQNVLMNAFVIGLRVITSLSRVHSEDMAGVIDFELNLLKSVTRSNGNTIHNDNSIESYLVHRDSFKRLFGYGL